MILSLENITVVILAGGLGTRLSSIINDRPKVLVDVRGKPFLAYLLEQAAAVGVKHGVLCTGYRGEQVKAAVADIYAGISLSYSQETTPLGTAGALRLALPLFQSKTVIAMNGDSFCEVNFNDLWAWHIAHKANATLVLTHKADTSHYGRVSISNDGTIIRFEEKNDTVRPGWINSGIYILKQIMLQSIPTGREVSLERETFPAWVGQGLYGYQSKGRFLDIGTPESYALAHNFFASEKMP